MCTKCGLIWKIWKSILCCKYLAAIFIASSVQVYLYICISYKINDDIYLTYVVVLYNEIPKTHFSETNIYIYIYIYIYMYICSLSI